MVKLSDLIRKTAEETKEEKKYLVTEALQAKEETTSLPEIQKIYKDSILHLKQTMNNIKLGKATDWREIVNLAEKIIDKLTIDKNMLLSLINDFSLYDNEKDYLYAHSVNVSVLGANLGLALGYDKNELVELCASGLIHDIGMLKISEKIVNKPSKLDKEEYEQIKNHPKYGLELLDNINNSPQSASDVIYQHHERIDGTGYPEGKTGEEISKYAKIVAIAEVYEAITHPRPYHRSIPYEGVRMIVQEARTSFEPEFVKLFLNHFTPYPPGSLVVLNNNEVGRVVHINEGLPLRPIVEIIYDSEGKPSEKLKRIDLSKSPVLNIKSAVDESNL